MNYNQFIIDDVKCELWLDLIISRLVIDKITVAVNLDTGKKKAVAVYIYDNDELKLLVLSAQDHPIYNSSQAMDCYNEYKKLDHEFLQKLHTTVEYFFKNIDELAKN